MNTRSYNKNTSNNKNTRHSNMHTNTNRGNAHTTNMNKDSEGRSIKQTIKTVTTVTVPKDILVVASELANCLNIKEIDLFGTRSRKLILKAMEWPNDKLDKYNTSHMSFWVDENYVNKALLDKKFRKIDENCYEFYTESTNQTVKLFVTPGKMLSNFWVNNIYLHLKHKENSKEFSPRADIVGQQPEKEHLLKAGKSGSMHVNKDNTDFPETVRRDPAFIMRAYKETLKGYEPTPEVKKILQNMTIPEDQFSACKDKLADMFHSKLLENGDYFLKDVDTFAAMKQVSDYYKTCARFQKNPEQVIPAAAPPAVQPQASQSIQPSQSTQSQYSRVPVFFTKRIDHRELNNPFLLLQQGEDLYFGFNGKKQNSVLAVKWFTGAMHNGCVPAQYYLGLCYLHGDGVEKNPETAFQYFLTAANQGLIVAQTELACLYLTGEGTELNLEEGMRLMESAAESNDPYALRCLSHFCEKGEGLPQNSERAQYFKELSTSAYEHRWRYQQEVYPEFKPGM